MTRALLGDALFRPFAAAAIADAAASAAERAAAAAGSAGAGAPQYASRVMVDPPSPAKLRGLQPKSPRGWLQNSHSATSACAGAKG